MITEVIMKRELFGEQISQKSKTEFFSATDLVLAGNKWRILNNKEMFNYKTWLHTKSTKEFIDQLEKEFGNVIIKSKGKGHHTWMHPFLFIDLALAINPVLKIEVYKWLYDHLIQYRNYSGDSYKKMCGALLLTCSNKSNYTKEIISLAKRIKIECGIIDWQTASEKQLKLRDKIHEYIALFSDIIRNRENLIDIAIKKAKEEVNKKDGVK